MMRYHRTACLLYACTLLGCSAPSPKKIPILSNNRDDHGTSTPPVPSEDIPLPSLFRYDWPDRRLIPAETKQISGIISDNPILREILEGHREVSRGRGEHIRRVQRMLMFLGYDLPLHGADGGLGKETQITLGEFQEDNDVPQTRQIDAATLAKLNKKVASYEEQQVLQGPGLTKYPDYGSLFDDGLLDIVIGIGYDEGDRFFDEISKVKDYLDSNYMQIDTSEVRKIYKSSSADVPIYLNGGIYYRSKKPFNYRGRDISILIRFLGSLTARVTMRNIFIEAMIRSDVTIYSGHGRYGTGPDFFMKHSPEGKIPINPSPELNDTEARTFYKRYPSKELPLSYTDHERKYKIWFFDGCNTAQYFTALREKNHISPQKTDAMGWGKEIAISTTSKDVIAFLDLIIDQSSVQDIVEKLNDINKVKRPITGIHGQGFGGNPSQP